ncbi:MAG: hypothetical protein NVSMB27_22740 [Ktedonobacteraceae bacterium]
MKQTKVVIVVPYSPFGEQNPGYNFYNGERRSLKGYNLWNHIQDAIGEVSYPGGELEKGGVLTITLESKSDNENKDG